MSDFWNTYQCLQFKYNQHMTINHSYKLLKPNIGAHTQRIERLCWEVRANVPRFWNRKQHFHGHIPEFLFRRRFSDLKTRLRNLWVLMADLCMEVRLHVRNRRPNLKQRPIPYCPSRHLLIKLHYSHGKFL